jgi:transcriptional regulator with XRE-family HTH domain
VAGNPALRAARERRGWTQTQLIHAIQTRAAARGMASVSSAHIKRRIASWENEGIIPGADLYQPLLCEIYGATPADLGFVPSQLAMTLEFPGEPLTSVARVAAICELDLFDDPQLREAGPLADGLSAPSVAWLLARPDDSVSRLAAGRSVTMDDVASVHDMAGAFEALDFKLGGGFGRTALAQFYRHDVRPMLERSYTDSVGRALYAAAAELVEVLAWTAYDTGQHGAAQGYFVQALRLAHAADDRMFGGTVLANLSHQANYLGDSTQAAQLARAAQEGARGRATPTAMALFAAHEARAHATAGDEKACTVAMREAERFFEQARPADDPAWLRYFDGAELAGEFAHCFRDLGIVGAGREYVDRAISATDPAYARTLGFVRMVRASIDLRSGDLEGALTQARGAVRDGHGLKSERFRRYVRDFRDQLKPLAGQPAVTEFTNDLAVELAG